LIRLATASSFMDFAASLDGPVTNWVKITMITIGTANARNTTAASCCGVLMKD